MDTAFQLNQEAPLGHAFQSADRILSRLQRMVNSTQRNFRDALRELERLQELPLVVQPPPSPEISPESPNAHPNPTPETPPCGPQPSENGPVSPARQFVSSSSAPALSARRAAPQKPLPYHRPGTTCYFDPIDPTPYDRCPLCFPPNGTPEAED
jgi:hypothetical protein